MDAAKKLGIDVIITDHHETQNGLPEAYVIVNPKLDKKLESLHILSGVGIAFKLGHGFIKYGRSKGYGGERFDLKEGLDLVALGTVADIVPLTGENRILVKQGLKVLSRQHRPGVMALCEASGCQTTIKSTEITFALAPRINAAGRLGDPLAAFNLLTSSNIVEASHYAQILNDYNKLRQEKEDFILNEATAVLALNPDMLDRLSIVLWGEDWHQGVIGIVASRLSKLYNRPAIIFSIKGDVALGSGRSVTGLNLIEILSECSSLLDRFGGHPMAAGLSMKSANLPEFMASFEKLSQKNFEEKIPPQALDIDGEIEIGDLDPEFFNSLENLEPFGHSNSQPLFLFRGLQPIKLSPAAAVHSRGYLKDYKNASIPFIAFNKPVSSFPSSGLWDVVATPSMNYYNGSSNRQLQIVDVSE
ncbi:MAG: hypothetical protein A2X49_07880 [Lentisphaerae bacterium GWF2_52_8]|nr:MAG: hypothetical protein A2X49_07880 [Lentisphaerae bacterium GWF2_52_8]